MEVSLSNIKEVVTLASSVRTLGESWYKTSIAVEDFRSKVAKLERTYKSWEKEARKYGVSSDGTLRSSLDEAKEQLQREEARLKRLDKGCGCLWWCLSCGTDIPEQLGKSIGDLNDIISGNLKADDNARDALWKMAEEASRSTFLPFGRDRRYVKIPKIEQHLKNVLNNEDSGYETAFVVLLHGRAGSGKSSVARHLALDYRQAATSDAASSANGCRTFDDVFYVQCGPKVDFQAKRAELLGMLHPKTSFDKQQEQDPNYTKRMLAQLLTERCSFIIFDDVWDALFLEDLVGVCGRHVRILVTSQTTALCDHSSFETELVPMNIDAGDSFKILKVHSGFRDEDAIPEDVKRRMDLLVTKVGGHPHALASLAVTVDGRYRKDCRIWENVIEEYDQRLGGVEDISDSTHPKNFLHGVLYENSIMKAVHMKFGRLGKEERKLMIIIVLLEGLSVSENVVQLFHAKVLAQSNGESVRLSRSFLDARKRLEDLQCIKTGLYQYDIRTGEYPCVRSWSIHSLDEQYVHRQMKHEMDLVLEEVKHLPDKIQGLEAEAQVDAAKVLGIFFFKWECAVDVGTPSASSVLWRKRWKRSHFGDSNWQQLIMPVIGWMARNVGEDWDITCQKSADQVFLSCLMGRLIHKNACKNLLHSSVSRRQVWTLIRESWWVEIEVPIDEDLVVGLLELFGDSGTAPLNLDQCEALLDLVRCRSMGGIGARSCVSQIGELVFRLIEMLTSPSCPRNTKDLSAVVLGYLMVPLLSNTSSGYGQEVFARTPVILEQIYGSQKYSDFPIQRYASGALKTLARESNSDMYQKVVMAGLQALGTEQVDLQLVVDTFNDLSAENLGRLGSKYPQIISASLIQDLTDRLAEKISAEDPDKHPDVVLLLTSINPERGESFVIHSFDALFKRGVLLVKLGQYQGGVNDLEKARNQDFERFSRRIGHQILIRGRVPLQDWGAALEDFGHWEESLNQQKSRAWDFFHQERGVFKRMTGDLCGALEDLNKVFQEDPDDYEVAKHIAYVKFLMGDKDGARADGEQALPLRPDNYDRPGHDSDCLGGSIVEFIGFRL